MGQQILQPRSVGDQDNSALSLQQLLNARSSNPVDSSSTLTKALPKPGEFELYTTRLLGRKLPRFGENLVLPALRDFAAPATATVPPGYIVQPGDEIVIALSGSIDGSVSREVDTNGNIFLAGVGTIKVAGVRHSDLRGVISNAVGRQYRGYTVSVSVRQVRGIRVYVTGLANNPGAFTVSSLSTLANAVFQAGGPSSGGSWRSVKLYRNGAEIADFDLYQLMRGGSRISDVPLQNEDVLFIPPAGEQVAVIGSVQEEAIYEAKPGETIADMLAAAGGPNTLADRSRFILYRTGDINMVGPQEMAIGQAALQPIRGADIVQVLSTGSLAMPIERQSVLVRVEGEVRKPGIYFVAPNTPTSDIVAQAGGMTSIAFPYGTKFTRQSVKIQQQESFREAVRQLELSLAAAPLSASTSVSESERANQIAAARSVLERLRQAEPDGRVVLQLPPNAQTIPGNILLENNDAIYVPPRPTTVGIFGAVYRPASFFVGEGKPIRVADYIEKAGGTLRAADRGNIFLVRANGEVVSKKRGSLRARVLPGDIVFVPVRTQGNSFWAKFKDITQTLFQLGLSAATVVAVTK
ncbi:SLBB domain-containing protein [Novosphingobium sp. PS1R-30]|uniref:SLBB domain-containing protein n=1 Tax=Novosphingobium anseongense TaxID=3133436 RepID=A0ABU8RVL7_9SPHN